MNLFAEMRFLVIAALDKMTVAGELPEGLSFDNVAVEPPRDALHGDGNQCRYGLGQAVTAQAARYC